MPTIWGTRHHFTFCRHLRSFKYAMQKPTGKIAADKHIRQRLGLGINSHSTQTKTAATSNPRIKADQIESNAFIKFLRYAARQSAANWWEVRAWRSRFACATGSHRDMAPTRSKTISNGNSLSHNSPEHNAGLNFVAKRMRKTSFSSSKLFVASVRKYWARPSRFTMTTTSHVHHREV